MHEDALTPEILLRAYGAGIFPMAESHDATTLHWFDPRQRGILPLDGFRISRSLARSLRKSPFTISFDTDFAGVMRGCAARPETWINPVIFELCCALHARGHAHSVEIRDGAELVGGVYGITLGGAFFGESMFSRRRDVSKIALAYLVDRLRAGGFVLFDTQFLTPHLASLGGVECSRAEYHARLRAALMLQADFNRQPEVPTAGDVLARHRATVTTG